MKTKLTVFILILLISKNLLAQKAWQLTGNSNIDTSKNFIGTIDNKPLIFRTNNTFSGLIDPVTFNIFFGIKAGNYPESGTNNIAIGNHALANFKGNGNIAIGTRALHDNIDGIYNTAIGYGSLTYNTNGEFNTAIGNQALKFNTTGGLNVASGSFALLSNTTGNTNTATGYEALSYNTTGNGNTATGTFALGNNGYGSFNTAIGGSALSQNGGGNENTAVGADALWYNKGNGNVAVGNLSIYTNQTGSYNTGLGYHTDVSADNLTNATAIGNAAVVDASNKVRIGNSSVTSIGGQVGWTNYSDERIKNDIKENVPGLAFIKQLRAVTYHFNLAKQNQLLAAKDTMQWQGKNDIEKTQYTGFLAQEVDAAAKKINYDFSGVDKSGKVMGLRYSEFVVPLVKAVQELSQQNDDLKKELEDMKSIVLALQTQMQNGNVSQQSAKLSEATMSRLEQNTPNPFKNNAIIRYSIPLNATSAQIVITNVNGMEIKKISLSKGSGQTTITAGTLAPGTYTYSLIVDGKKADSRQMIIVR